MLTPHEASAYERQSNTAAGLCASCTKPLNPDEVHCCAECAESFLECDPNVRMCDDEFTQRS
ncbi:NinF protein [Flyfo siphovirus Tbat2_3]|nr:NinF protein [Flyfo siphovirus Tbat2_3]